MFICKTALVISSNLLHAVITLSLNLWHCYAGCVHSGKRKASVWCPFVLQVEFVEDLRKISHGFN